MSLINEVKRRKENGEIAKGRWPEDSYHHTWNTGYVRAMTEVLHELEDGVTITVPKALAQHFLKIAEQCLEALGHVGNNDFFIDDTPENRELIDRTQALACGMTLEEYRASDEFHEPCIQAGSLCTFDTSMLDLFVDEVKKVTQ